jgi:hypothetical protein
MSIQRKKRRERGWVGRWREQKWVMATGSVRERERERERRREGEGVEDKRASRTEMKEWGRNSKLNNDVEEKDDDGDESDINDV